MAGERHLRFGQGGDPAYVICGKRSALVEPAEELELRHDGQVGTQGELGLISDAPRYRTTLSRHRSIPHREAETDVPASPGGDNRVLRRRLPW